MAKCISNSIESNEKKKWAQNGSLGNSTGYRFGIRSFFSYANCLFSVEQIVGEKLFLNSLDSTAWQIVNNLGLACQTPCSNLWKLNQWFLLYSCFLVLRLEGGSQQVRYYVACGIQTVCLKVVSDPLGTWVAGCGYIFPGFLNKPVELLLVCSYPFHVLTLTCKLGLFTEFESWWYDTIFHGNVDDMAQWFSDDYGNVFQNSRW